MIYIYDKVGCDLHERILIASNFLEQNLDVNNISTKIENACSLIDLNKDEFSGFSASTILSINHITKKYRNKAL